MDAQELTSLLTEVRATGFARPTDVTPGELLGPMLEHVGSPDPVLRDRLVYATFVHWIELQELFTVDEVRRVLDTVIDDEHLWLGIDGPEGDATLTRSFSVLLLPLVLVRHRSTPFLAPDEVTGLVDVLTRYLASERDLRGLDPDRGWVHALAHAGDAVNELALCEELDRVAVGRLLDAVADRIRTTSTPLVHDEDDRLLEVVDSLLGRDLLGEDDWAAWVARLTHTDDTDDAHPTDPAAYHRAGNVRRALRTLLHRCLRDDLPAHLTALVLAALADLDED